MGNGQTSVAILERLSEIGPEGIEARFLHEEFGPQARRCIVRLSFRQFLESAVLWAETDSVVPSSDQPRVAIHWSCPHPLNTRNAVRRLASPRIRVRISPFGLFVLSRKKSSGLDELNEADAQAVPVYLHDLLLAIHYGAHKLIDIVEPIVNEEALPWHRLQMMKQIRDDLETRWRSAIMTFNAAITAHAHHSLKDLTRSEINELATVVRHLDVLSRLNPRKPHQDDFVLLDNVDLLAAALPLRLHSLAPEPRQRKRKARRPVPANLGSSIAAALSQDPLVSQRTLAFRFNVSPTTINDHPAWKAVRPAAKKANRVGARERVTEERRVRDEQRRTRSDAMPDKDDTH